MLATHCACGFERLADEEVRDHLLTVFEPDDSIGTDGQVHQEMELRVCSCGVQAASGEELEAHFLAVFTPANFVGSDGQEHRAVV